MNKWMVLLMFIALTLTVAYTGYLFTDLSVHTWYPKIAKPDWTPPNWLFGPVWTTLYVLMAISVWLVWRTGERNPLPYILWGAQLFFNHLWSPLFFGAHQIQYALLDLGLLWVTLVATMLVFWSISRWATLLLVPYLIWISYAFALNYSIHLLN